MEQCLQSEDFLQLVNAHRNDKQRTPLLTALPSVYTEDCAALAFDIVDNKAGGTIIRPQGKGTAHYLNSPQHPVRNMRFIAYEDYINRLGTAYNHEWSRVDFIAYDTSDMKSYVILHELSEGKWSSKRSKALKQLQSTLMRLLDCPKIQEELSKFQHRWCIISATEGAQQAPLDMTAGFNLIYQEIPDPEPLKAALITNRGFQAWKTLHVKL
jgi:hypothetical protein